MLDFISWVAYNIDKGGAIMTQINLKVEDEVKARAEEVCQDIGISLSSAINIYLKKLGNERRIPFELTADPFYSQKNVAYLERILEDIGSGNAKFQKHDLIEED